MSDISIQKAELREFNRQINGQDAERITIKYQTKKVNETNLNWTIGDPWQYDNIRCLRKIISDASFADTTLANVLIGKNIFRVPFGDCDFSNNEKRNIIVIDAQGLSYSIDKVTHLVKIGNGFLVWQLIQR